MYESCPNCQAIAQPEWDTCRICGADLSEAARTPQSGIALEPAGGSKGPRRTTSPGSDDKRILKIVLIAAGVLFALVLVGVAVLGGGDDSTSSDEQATRQQPVSTLERPSTTSTVPPTTAAQGEAGDALGAVLPVNDLVAWQNVETGWDVAAFEEELRNSGLRPTAIDEWVGQPLEVDGPTIGVLAVKLATNEDVRTQEFMRYGMTPEGVRFLTFELAGRSAIYGEPDDKLLYMFGGTEDTLLVVLDIGDTGAGDMTNISEAIVAANP